MVQYDALAVAYAVLRHQPAIATGRLEAVAELSTLLAERRAIQARRIGDVQAVARWLEPAPSPLAALRVQKRLERILGVRR